MTALNLNMLIVKGKKKDTMSPPGQNHLDFKMNKMTLKMNSFTILIIYNT